MEKWSFEIGEFRPGYDVYNSGKLQRCIVRVNPSGKNLVADTESQPNCTTFRLYNGQEYEAAFDLQDGYYPTRDAVESYLATEEATSLLDRIFEGYSERWNGHASIGKLDDNASEAWEMLLDRLSSLCTTPKTAITAEEVLAECREECLTFTSHEDVQAFSESMEKDGYYLDYSSDLWELIQEAKAEEEEE